jgi:hypothetical protein
MATRSSNRLIVIACQAGLVVGMLLVLAGALWQIFARPEHVWSESKAAKLQAARTAWHDLTYSDPASPSAPESPERAAQRAAARKNFEHLQSELDEAVDVHRQRGPRLMYAGLAAIVLFGVGYLSARRE